MKKLYIGNICNGMEVAQGGGKNHAWYYRRRGGDSNGKWSVGSTSRREACELACEEISLAAEVGHAWAIELLRVLNIKEGMET